MFSKILLAVLLTTSAFAEGIGRNNIIELVNSGHYFSVIPWVKDYMVKHSGSLDAGMDAALDKIIYHVGVKTFETLPENILRKSKSPNVRYILAKRHLINEQYRDGLSVLGENTPDHAAAPFIHNIRGTLYSSVGQQSEAISQFRDCIKASEEQAGEAKTRMQKEQYVVNRDFCLAGVARAHFASGDFKQAELTYLDVSKDSFIWPEILFEEAWTSYYLKNYNRTLGKLVSYKAPIFDFIFKPEIDVLNAMTYMKMCLFEDAKKTADAFYELNYNPAKNLRALILKNGKDYRYYYELMADHESGKVAGLDIVDTVLKAIRKDSAYLEIKGSLSAAVAEFNTLKGQTGNTRNLLLNNMKIVIDDYRKILGSYVRVGMVSKYAELYKAFQYMSYIKLETLAQRKERLYQSDDVPGKKRGDVKYIDRNDKQYFWTFNGEFWADELGDYVFALRSEC
jgi:hypothetical protein